MSPGAEYSQDIRDLVSRIDSACPRDIGTRFSEECGIREGDYIPVSTTFQGSVAAIDGSNAMVAESALFSVAAFRAAASCFSSGKRKFLSRTPLRMMHIGPEREVPGFPALYSACFRTDPKTSLSSEDRTGAAGALRDTLEYAAAMQTLSRLEGGDTLLLDGSLHVSHASHLPVLTALIKTAADKGVAVAAVSKRTSATWGGGLALIPAVAKLADSLKIAAPWGLRIPEDCLDRQPHWQWQRGSLWVVRLHPKTQLSFKVELPEFMNDEEAGAACAGCAAYADDGRFSGYPYPLADAHRAVCITEDISERMRQDLISGLERKGMRKEDYNALFGDYHDELARY